MSLFNSLPRPGLAGDTLLAARGEGQPGLTLERLPLSGAATGALLAGGIDAAIGTGWRDPAAIRNDPEFTAADPLLPPSEYALQQSVTGINAGLADLADLLGVLRGAAYAAPEYVAGDYWSGGTIAQ